MDEHTIFFNGIKVYRTKHRILSDIVFEYYSYIKSMKDILSMQSIIDMDKLYPERR